MKLFQKLIILFLSKKDIRFTLLLIPFVIVSLLLITLSVPKDNLLINLLIVLQSPDEIWIPAVILTIFSTIIYMVTLGAQIQQSYLHPDNLFIRTCVTALLYLFLYSLFVYIVMLSKFGDTSNITPPLPGILRLRGFSGDNLSVATIPVWKKIWVCILVSILSLIGIGWSKPDAWIKYLSDKFPNYLEANLFVDKIKDMVQGVGSKRMAEKQDVEAFYESIKNLQKEIEKNLQKEPKWARNDLENISNKLTQLLITMNNQFPSDDINSIKTFSSACRLVGREKFKCNYKN